jgi:hypothetical protein
VRDVHGGDAEGADQPADLHAQLAAERGVEVGQRLVHQEDRRFSDHRAAHRDPLPLAAGQRAGQPVQHRVDPQRLGQLDDPLIGPGRVVAGDLQGEGKVAAHAAVGVQRPGLKDHRDVALAREQVVGVFAPQPQLAGADLLQPGDHPQNRRLAASGGAEQHEQLAVPYVQAKIPHGTSAPRIDLGHPVQDHVGHEPPTP